MSFKNIYLEKVILLVLFLLVSKFAKNLMKGETLYILYVNSWPLVARIFVLMTYCTSTNDNLLLWVFLQRSRIYFYIFFLKRKVKRHSKDRKFLPELQYNFSERLVNVSWNQMHVTLRTFTPSLRLRFPRLTIPTRTHNLWQVGGTRQTQWGLAASTAEARKLPEVIMVLHLTPDRLGDPRNKGFPSPCDWSDFPVCIAATSSTNPDQRFLLRSGHALKRSQCGHSLFHDLILAFIFQLEPWMATVIWQKKIEAEWGVLEIQWWWHLKNKTKAGKKEDGNWPMGKQLEWGERRKRGSQTHWYQ